MVYRPNYDGDGKRYVLEHRLIYERTHGVTLTRADVIHHINGDKTDNRIENLVRTTQSVHRAMHPLSDDHRAKLQAGARAWLRNKRRG